MIENKFTIKIYSWKFKQNKKFKIIKFVIWK